MYNFDFYNPTHIVFGKDRLGELDAIGTKGCKGAHYPMVVAPTCAVVLLIALWKALGNRKVEQFNWQ